MSDYCGTCSYDPKMKMGERACPFSYLYWSFLLEHVDKLERNARLALPYRTLAAMTDERRHEIRSDAQRSWHHPRCGRARMPEDAS